MAANENLGLLQNELARFIPLREDIIAVAWAVGLPRQNIRLDGKGLTIWSDVLDEAINQRKVLEIVRHVLKTYSSDDLNKIKDWLEQGGEEDLLTVASRPNAELHQRYLKWLVEEIGTVNLALINPDQSGNVFLEEVYVDLPTPLSIGFEEANGQVIEWWLRQGGKSDRELPDGWIEFHRSKPEEMGYERAPLEALVGKLAAKNKDNEIHLHLQHLAATRNRLVILGAPGSGKSTFVRYLALCLAGASIVGWTRGVNLNSLENWQHEALTPVYVELRRFVTSDHCPKSGGITVEHLWNYISKELLGEDLKEYTTALRNELEQGHALLILDGLDEVPYDEGKLRERQAQLSGLAQSLQTRFGGSRIIVTSRPYAYEGWSLPGFEAVSISEFENEQRKELARRLYRASGLSDAAAQTKADALNIQLEQIDRELKDRPLFVTLMATLYLKGGEGGLPTKKGRLYRESILLLLDRWTRSRPGAPSLTEILGDKTVGELYGLLAALAYAVHDSSNTKERTAEIKEGLLLEYLRPMGKYRREAIVTYLCENAGVLVAPGQRGEEEVFHFAHRTFQEYLAAEQLVKECGKQDSYASVRNQIVAKPETWRVPCTFVGDVLADTERKHELWRLLGELLEDAPPETGNAQRWWLCWLAATVAQEQELYSREKLNKLTEQPIRNELVKWLVALLGTAQALPPVEWAYCGRVLGLLGDTRPGVGLRKDCLPDIVWCEIPAPQDGKFIMGSNNYDDRNPRHEEKLVCGFKMAKYPITYRQFQSFIDLGEYNKAEWWRDFPAEHQTREIRPPYNNIPNHPRDNVWWYQAVAFTRWLTAKYRAIGELKEGEELRLPTEVEWEYAARGTDERQYPYGNEFDKNKGNTVETGIGSSSAVGCFPDGKSPFEVLDMSGNLWEWCLNKGEDPNDVQIGYSNDAQVLRGGAFNYSPDYVSCVYLSVTVPYYGNSSCGFRVVVSATIAQY